MTWVSRFGGIRIYPSYSFVAYQVKRGGGCLCSHWLLDLTLADHRASGVGAGFSEKKHKFPKTYETCDVAICNLMLRQWQPGLVIRMQKNYN